ncbi:hypothetical protein CcCBS67573_g02818 [Chytriomyces confervae]|uniref:Uncharacterized protein n=1 Tax=Chytriomyces confervae TaxID=246404 RepID=A0A507FLK7_9FUNG|nr:hypothetical protein HDU80_007045 [Chytriomyces hyalinus]TPX75907.1 hypothetical protein CcCBS67573_g02818 [Chytriomyces confervae]
MSAPHQSNPAPSSMEPASSMHFRRSSDTAETASTTASNRENPRTTAMFAVVQPPHLTVADISSPLASSSTTRRTGPDRHARVTTNYRTVGTTTATGQPSFRLHMVSRQESAASHQVDRPPQSTTRSDVSGLQSLLQLIENITRLEEEERIYEQQVATMTRQIEMAESLIAAISDSARPRDQVGPWTDEASLPTITSATLEGRDQQSVGPAVHPERGMRDFNDGTFGFEVVDLSEIFPRNNSALSYGPQTPLPVFIPSNGRISRMGHYPRQGNDPFDSSFNRPPQAIYNFDFSINDEDDDHDADEDSNHGTDIFQEFSMSHFNAAMSGLRLIYHNRRNHHVRMGDTDSDTHDESDSDAGSDEDTEETARPPLFFENGYASVLENWLISQPILDSNGCTIQETSDESHAEGVGFMTPEGNGGTDLLWRAYDMNGNIRMNPDGMEYAEVIEFQGHRSRNDSYSDIEQECRCCDINGSTRSLRTQRHEVGCPLVDRNHSGVITFSALKETVGSAVANARKRIVEDRQEQSVGR